jgi:integrase
LGLVFVAIRTLKKRVQNLRSDFRLGPAEKADARSALVLLAGTGLSLTDAARRAVLSGDVRPPAFRTVVFTDALRDFIAYTHGKKRRLATLAYYEAQLSRFGESPLAGRWQRVTRPELRKWLDSLPQGATMKAMMFRCLRAFYRWGARQEPPLVGRSPTEGMAFESEIGAQGESPGIKFYGVGEVEKLLGALDGETRCAVVAQLFAGLRPEEVVPRQRDKGGIGWEHFLFAERLVRVPAEVAKTRRARVLENLPAALWEWLASSSVEGRSGALWKRTDELYRWRLGRALGAVGVARIRDGFRHTFATYAVALCGDAGQVALWLGHEGRPTMLHRHYRGLVTRAEATAFFALRPQKSPGG